MAKAPEHTKRLLLEMYHAAVAAAHPATCLPPHLPPVPRGGRILVIGAGKAAAAMAQATERHYAALGHADKISGSVTTRHGYGLPTKIIEVLEAGHPVPDAMSAASAERAMAAVAAAGPNDLVLCLLSGGASALWAAPVAGVSLEDKQVLTQLLLRSGARISEINCVRKHLSRIKGGKLAAALPSHAQMLTLAISDVPGDDRSAIGSGPTAGDETTLEEAFEVIERYELPVPTEILQALADSRNETVRPNDPRLAPAQYAMVAAPKASLEAAGAIAAREGYYVDILGHSLEGEARDVARFHAALAQGAKRRDQKIAILSGGELTVTVRGSGRGGPNQEYALGLALALDGAPGITGLAGDTDGTDGGTGKDDDPAGAFVLDDTLTRARDHNLNAAQFLANNDSTGFFRNVDGLILCGPTQTNVNDFRVVLVTP